MAGIFGDMFDFDNDGELDFFERVAECMFLEKDDEGNMFVDDVIECDEDDYNKDDFELDFAGLY